MAIKLSANYSKKLGLPKFSSHSFSVSVETELTDLSQVENECSKLYELLQHSVDQEIQNVGFVPGNNGHSDNGNQRQHPQTNGNGSTGYRAPKQNWDTWKCTPGQKGFILRLIDEHKLEKQDVENLALQLFNFGVKELNMMQASQLIEELLIKVGKSNGRRRWQRTSTTQPA